MYRIIRASLGDFRNGTVAGKIMTDGNMRTERETQSFCPTLQLLDMSTVGDAAGVILQSSSCHTLCNFLLAMEATSSTILCHSCGKSPGVGACAHNPWCKPIRKKNHRCKVRWPWRPRKARIVIVRRTSNQRSGRLAMRWARTSIWKCGASSILLENEVLHIFLRFRH
jgi:hypothetical protein